MNGTISLKNVNNYSNKNKRVKSDCCLDSVHWAVKKKECSVCLLLRTISRSQYSAAVCFGSLTIKPGLSHCHKLYSCDVISKRGRKFYKKSFSK